MKIEDFKSGVFRKRFEYMSFSPSPINQTWTWEEPRLNSLLEEANRHLGELNAFSRYVPDVDLFIQMHVFKEATTSSRIEGTKTLMDEAVKNKEEVDPEKRDDWQEVHNYVQAMNHAIVALQKLPLSSRLLRDTHRTLLSGVRGKHKQPGEFRTSQNWIGPSLKDAMYIPPDADEVAGLMSDLEKFWHDKTIEVPHLIRAAISHYQFETIHPFLDGNGRIGRLMIPLYLIHADVLSKPCLYLSDFFERNKGGYFDSLTLVRQNSDLNQWIKFFLTAVIETSKKGTETFSKILKLRDEVNAVLLPFNRTQAQNAHKLMDRLYRTPYLNVEQIRKIVGVSKPAAYVLARKLENLKILKEYSGSERGKMYGFKRYLDLF